MARKVFYSFHFDNDNWRAGKVRNIGVIEGDKPVSGNKWEEVKSKSDYTIKAWIDDNLKDKSCLVVLIGEKTSERKWVDYEIKRAWELGKAVCGIYIHNLEDVFGKQSRKGKNPLNTHIPIFDSSYASSKYVYDDIKNNISDLVEKAIRIRSQYD
ncbi:TIR domain-containing protein [Flavobacterium sp. xlx-214]|uniref:TIR domain-containing protein n=1 Tax=unclassified Flavobacterium TaxID=196869 RepID=UPI0015EF1AB4|nr:MULTISPECIES: TIR domain-containing protein [unclassified Flavobacterium]MBA5791681.1 TIR domain-containing protein [Flavobacterium sp. xlx-221]QMI82924.1 TIR domain-containing protein [Flavobacterium sp. xlx-214]